MTLSTDKLTILQQLNCFAKALDLWYGSVGGSRKPLFFIHFSYYMLTLDIIYLLMGMVYIRPCQLSVNRGKLYGPLFVGGCVHVAVRCSE